LFSGAAAVTAAAALIKARRAAKRLERLTESYWELRYEHAQLRARLNRIDPDPAAAAPDAPRQAGVTAFVPLSALKDPSAQNPGGRGPGRTCPSTTSS
jgi:hypothetical protein